MSDPVPGDLISVGDQYYILASTFTADLPKLVLKHDEAFFVADRRGDFPDVPDSEFGFYVGGTRFLDRFDLRVHGQRPLLLNSAVSGDNLQVAVDLTNADVHDGDTILLAGARLDQLQPHDRLEHQSRAGRGSLGPFQSSKTHQSTASRFRR